MEENLKNDLVASNDNSDLDSVASHSSTSGNSIEQEIQYGVSAEADFENNTWTFQMENTYWVKAGEFVIMPKSVYQFLVQNLVENIEHKSK